MFSTAWTMLKETVSDFLADNCLSRGASIAYYTIFSIGPILLIVIAIAGFVFGQDAARGAIVDQLQGMMGREAAETVQGALAGAGKTGSGVVATVIGIATLLFAATGVFGELQYTLNQIWRATPPEGVTAMIKARAASLGLVATFGFLLLVSLVVSAALTAAGAWLNQYVQFPGLSQLLQVTTFVVSLLILTLMFAAIYKILPDKPLTWKDVGIGAFSTAVLFTVGKTVIGLYIGSTSPASSFGAAGALVVFLVWVYYSSQIILLGAEFTKVYAIHHGSQALFSGSAASTVPDTPARQPAPPVRPLGLFDVAMFGMLAVWVTRSLTRRPRPTPPRTP